MEGCVFTRHFNFNNSSLTLINSLFYVFDTSAIFNTSNNILVKFQNILGNRSEFAAFLFSHSKVCSWVQNYV